MITKENKILKKISNKKIVGIKKVWGLAINWGVSDKNWSRRGLLSPCGVDWNSALWMTPLISGNVEQLAIQRHSVTDTRHLQAPAEDTSFRYFPYLTHLVLNLRCAVFL